MTWSFWTKENVVTQFWTFDSTNWALENVVFLRLIGFPFEKKAIKNEILIIDLVNQIKG